MQSSFIAFLLTFLILSCTENTQQEMIRSADKKILDEKYNDGVEELKKAIALDPESGAATRAIYKLGFTLETYIRDPESALFHYKEFLKRNSDDVRDYEVRKRIAAVYYEQIRDSDSAREFYQQLLNRNPNSLEQDFFMFRVARSYYHVNKFRLSRKAYQALIQKFPKGQYSARTRYEIGNTYYMEGNYKIAIEALKQVLRNHSQSPYAVEAQFLMAQSLEHLGKKEQALSIFKTLRGRYSSPEVLEFKIANLDKRNRRRKK